MDGVKKVHACIRENLDKFPKLEEMPTILKVPIASRTESGIRLMEELYSKFKVDCGLRSSQAMNLSDECLSH